MAVVVWVGGGIMLQIVARRTMNAPPEALGSLAGTLEWAGGRVFGPASGIAFLTGIVMAFMYELWDQPWIWIAVAGFLASSFIGGARIAKEAKALKANVASNGPADAGVKTGIQKLLALSNIDLIILVVVIWDMVYKPFSGSI